jgi:UDP-glucose 4-epimerase
MLALLATARPYLRRLGQSIRTSEPRRQRLGSWMAILVTGGAGYIGSHMLLELLDAGENVTVIDNLSTGFRGAVPDGAKLVMGDVGDARILTQIFAENDIDASIHFAGSVVVSDSVTNPLGYYGNNTCSSRTLIECAVNARVKYFIFSSSAAVYGVPEQNPVHEYAKLAPISPYGTSKMMTEFMLRDVAIAHELRYVALRYFNVAGADPQHRSGQSTVRATHLIKVAAQAAVGRRPYVEVFGNDYPTPDGTCIRDYIHVTDLARAHMAALHHLRDGGGSEVLNCGYGRGFSVLEVIETVRRVSGVQFPVREGPRRPGDPAALVAGANRARQVLDWHPELDDLDVIVSHALGWERRLMDCEAT